MIRNATPDDIPALLELGELMHAESRYAHMKWSALKVCRLIEWLIENDEGLALVAERDGEVIGGFLGVIEEHYFTEEKVAGDLALFVNPDKRGGIAACQLLRAFIAWAQKQNVSLIQAGITTGVNLDTSTRLFEAVCGRLVGHLFEFEVARS